jgi:hypothetical protein
LAVVAAVREKLRLLVRVLEVGVAVRAVFR